MTIEFNLESNTGGPATGQYSLEFAGGIGSSTTDVYYRTTYLPYIELSAPSTTSGSGRYVKVDITTTIMTNAQ